MNFVFIGLAVFLLPFFYFISSFWFVFVLRRLCHQYKSYKKQVTSVYYFGSESEIDIYNCKLKCIMYCFFLLVIISETLCILSQSVGTILFNIYPEFGTYSVYPLDTFVNCTKEGFEIWEFELMNPLLAFCFGLRDLFLFVTCILVIGLIKFIFLAYQLKKDLSSVKTFLIRASFFLPFILLFSVVPQTQVLSKLTTPVFGIILTFLLFKHRSLYRMILKWRCDDAFILRDVVSYRYHLKIMRNSIFLFNCVLFSEILFIFVLVLSKFASLACMLLTEQSRYVTRLFHLDLNLAFLDCQYQHFIYNFHSIIDNIEPAICIISTVLYFIPYTSIAAGMFTMKICRVIQTREKGFQTRFEGNAHLFHPLRF